MNAIVSAARSPSNDRGEREYGLVHASASGGFPRLVVDVCIAVLLVAFIGVFGISRAAAAVSIVVSTSSNRANPVALNGARLSGPMYVFTTPDANVSRVQFFLDGALFRTENLVPFDFNGTGATGLALPYDPSRLAPGAHTVAAIATIGGSVQPAVSATFTLRDTIPPVISAVQALTVTATSATVSWTTSEAADSQVEYGTGTAYGSATPVNTTLVTAHSQVLQGLAAGTLYHYRVKSRDADGNLTTSSDYSFATVSAPATISLMLSYAPKRTGAVVLNGAKVFGTIYVFTTPDTGVSRVVFYLDGKLVRTENLPPYDLMGTAGDNSAYPLDTRTLAAGNHTLSATATVNGAQMAPISAAFTVLADLVAPTISDILVTDLTPSSATVTWRTDEAADSQVEYGLTASYGTATAVAAPLVTSHGQALSGLTANTVYHVRVKSKDAYGNQAASGDRVFVTALPPHTGAAYYVDSVLGVDAQDGLSAATAWKSLDKVNGTVLMPGDQVLFKRGGSWNGYLHIKDPGTATDPIYVGAYGSATDPKPMINARGIVINPTDTVDIQFSAAIFIDDTASYLTVDGFRVTNFDGADIYDGAEASRCGIRSGRGRTGHGTQTSIVISNNEVFNVEGFSNHATTPDNPHGGVARGSTLDPNVEGQNEYANAGIYLDIGTIDGLQVLGNYVHDSTTLGIYLVSRFVEAPNLLVQGNAIYHIAGAAIIVQNFDGPVVQLNSSIKAGYNAGDTLPTPGGELIGYHGVAECGMWPIASNNPVFQFNYMEGMHKIYYDGQAWDFDLENTGIAIYQYNFSRDNEGGFVLVAGPDTTEQRICRYNISVNDGGKMGNGLGFFNGHVDHYNNIFYRNDGGGFLMNSVAPVIGDFTNNIFVTNATSNITYQITGTTFANNAFFGHTPVQPGINVIQADPQFVDVSSFPKLTPGQPFTVEAFRDALKGFQLKSTSPLLNKGVTVNDNPGTDLWGNTLYNGAPDIGPFERP